MMRRLYVLIVLSLAVLAGAGFGRYAPSASADDLATPQVQIKASIVPFSGTAATHFGVTVTGLSIDKPFTVLARPNNTATWSPLQVSSMPRTNPLALQPAAPANRPGDHIVLEITPIVGLDGRIFMDIVPTSDLASLLPPNPAGFYHIAVCQDGACSDNQIRIGGGTSMIVPTGGSVIQRSLCGYEKQFLDTLTMPNYQEIPLIDRPGFLPVTQLGFNPLDPNVAAGCSFSTTELELLIDRAVQQH